MDETTLKQLETCSENELVVILLEFNKKHTQSFSFPNLGLTLKKHLLTLLFKQLENCKEHPLVCLETVRILSREKSEELFSSSHIEILVNLAGLVTNNDENQEQLPTLFNFNVVVEAQKCLCNLIYNNKFAQTMCSKNGCIEGILLRLRTYKDPELPHDVKFFDMRMMFLLTALCAEIRPKLRNCGLHCFTYLIEVLDLIQKESGADSCLDDQEVDLACEILKVLFNLTVSQDRYHLDDAEEALYVRLVSILHDLLLSEAKTLSKKEELQSHTIDLLTNMPVCCYAELLTPVLDNGEDKDRVFEGMDMKAILVLLDFLDKRLDKSHKTYKEVLSPIVTTLSECSRANRTIRKFLKKMILPPLTDVMNRPEEGPTLRNRLVKLMTSPVFDVKEIVADFIFVLCKENVNRLIKYTGYGNAAGLLANRGLMLGSKENSNDFSSDSEDSDTEEYMQYKDKINPILGCYQEPPPNPMEGLTEEQKEYEAMQLVNMMDRMSRDGLIQPMSVGIDGKPHILSHILEMKEQGLSKDPPSSD